MHSSESVNLNLLNKFIKDKIKAKEAVFDTPTGILSKRNGFSGIPEIIKQTEEEVIVLFKKPIK
ncbi:hypothetical protein [Olleya sp. R77988]|uniref:hypothetical protein n=1 Tax=Olleya sp. R77988 TaxID=3093875 RepID=UPI0037C7C0B2